MAKHRRRTKANRKGWYGKENDNNGIKYTDVFKISPSGYTGPRTEIHHLLPKEQVAESTSDVKPIKKRDYVEAVKHFTEYNLNNANNLLGLPHLIAYEAAAQVQAKGGYWGGRLRFGSVVVAVYNLIFNYNNPNNTHGMTGQNTRDEDEADFKSGTRPDGHAIHQPVNWGHTRYNAEIRSALYKRIWQTLDETKKKHDVDAVIVQRELHDVEDDKRLYLELKAKNASVDRWMQRDAKYGAGWWKPFCMDDKTPKPL